MKKNTVLSGVCKANSDAFRLCRNALLAVMLTFGVLLTACSKKAEAQTGGGAADVKQAAGAVKGLASALDKALAGDATAETINAFADALKSASPADLAGLNAKASPGGDFSYDLNKEGNGIIIKKYTGKNKVLIFPAEIEGYPVVQLGEIGPMASDIISYDDTLQVVVIPENVRVIGERAFVEMKNLRAVTFPSTLTTIEDSAFRKTGLQNVDLSHTSLTRIGGESSAGPFYECGRLQAVKLPDSLTAIGGATFQLCVLLTDINIPTNIQTIGAGQFGSVFQNCSQLYNLTIPDSITKIKFVGYESDYDGSFIGCGKLPLATRKRLQDLGYKGKF